MARLGISSPWVIFYREIEELFKYDPEVHVVYSEAENHIQLYVDDIDKACVLDEMLPDKKTFGNVEVLITVIPANPTAPIGTISSNADKFYTIFNGNSAFSFAKEVSGIFVNNLTYVVFKNKVVQYFNDDLGDIYGQCSTLYQEIAKHVFGEIQGVFFCTDVDGKNLSLPLGEWP